MLCQLRRNVKAPCCPICRQEYIAELEEENERLREYYDAHQAIEHGIIDFDLHHDAVERLRKAQQAIEESK